MFASSQQQRESTQKHLRVGDNMCFHLIRSVLHKIYDEVRLVDVMDSGDTAHLAMMKRPDLGVTFTKLHCWTLTHYSKCVFMDADTLVSITPINQ